MLGHTVGYGPKYVVRRPRTGSRPRGRAERCSACGAQPGGIAAALPAAASRPASPWEHDAAAGLLLFLFVLLLIGLAAVLPVSQPEMAGPLR